MGSHTSKHERQTEGSDASGSHKLPKDSSRESLREEEMGGVRDANLNVVVREPLDKRDAWGHMARVVHEKYASEW
jgi:hypothetical protein